MERTIVKTPIPVRKTTRMDEWRGLTSMRAGVQTPIAFFPLLREDRLRGRIMMQVKMSEALHVIVNPIHVVAKAWLWPKSIASRFNGSLETFNRSYQGQMMPDGTTAAPPFFQADAKIAGAGDDSLGLALYDKLGIHYKSTTRYHDDLVQAYTQIVNYRRIMASRAIPLVQPDSAKLHPAHWPENRFSYVKPTFDAALMEGEAPVTLEGGPAVEDVIATVSLANLTMARQAQQFAEMRARYQGIPDEYLIDLLMQGIRIPEQDILDPILIGETRTVIGQQERYATDAENLDVSVANGVATLSMTLNTPVINAGGLVMVIMEIVPEQLYERVADPALGFPAGGGTDWLPNYLRDTLDPQKVEIRENIEQDVLHSTPNGIFGYQPLNAGWMRYFNRVGGRYKRPVPDAFVEDRQRIWAVEKADPALTSDFYLCPDPFPHTVFPDANADPFEIITVARCSIVGNTVFGPAITEDDDHYDKIIAEIDQSRISGTAALDAPLAENRVDVPDAEMVEASNEVSE